jgi:thioredoxin reductase (NADPH)
LIEGLQPGGQLTTTTEVENWPGEIAILGPRLTEKMREQALHFGSRLIADVVTELDLRGSPFRCVTSGGDHYSAACVILATGAQARWLGLPREEVYRGFGVSACATCDGFFFRERHVVVVGGGNTAAEEALYLTRHAAKVTLIHRRDQLRAEQILQQRLLRHPKIDVLWNHVVDEILGEATPPRVTGVKARDVRSQARSTVPCDGVFVAIGHEPATELVRGQIALDDDGYVVTQPGSTATNVPGVFAAGDVADRHYRQAVTAAGAGCMAVLDAQRFLAAAAAVDSGQHSQVA